MATHSGSLAWRIPWTEEPGGRLFGTWGRTELDTAEQLRQHRCGPHNRQEQETVTRRACELDAE